MKTCVRVNGNLVDFYTTLDSDDDTVQGAVNDSPEEVYCYPADVLKRVISDNVTRSAIFPPYFPTSASIGLLQSSKGSGCVEMQSH